MGRRWKQTDTGATPFLFAVDTNAPIEVVSAFLAAGADPSVRDASGDSARDIIDRLCRQLAELGEDVATFEAIGALLAKAGSGAAKRGKKQVKKGLEKTKTVSKKAKKKKGR